MSTNYNGDEVRKSTANTGKKKMSKKARQAKKRKMILIVEIVVVLILLLILGLWMKFGRATWDDTIDFDEDIEVNDLDAETEALLDEYTTLALFGVDNRSNGNYDSGNSDSMMIVSINNTTKEVNVVSVLRDTYLEVSDDTYRKCNYAYNHGGAEQAINMLNKNLDLKISGYVAVDFYALAEVVDAIGGIEVTLTDSFCSATNPETGGPAFAGYIAEVATVCGKDFDDLDPSYYTFTAGTYTLDGIQTVAYCRNRYGGGDDYSRTERQREVIKKIVEKVVTAKASTLNEIIDDVLPDVATSLSASQVLALATSAGDYTIESTGGFPFSLTTGTYGSKGSLVVPCTLVDNVTSLHKLLYNQDDYVPTSTVQSISSQIQSDTSTTADSATVTQDADE